MSPEARARQRIDELLGAAGWHVCDYKYVDLHAARGVAIREFELAAGHGTADYLLYVDGRAAGVVEAKKEGATLTGVETQSARPTDDRNRDLYRRVGRSSDQIRAMVRESGRSSAGNRPMGEATWLIAWHVRNPMPGI